MKFTEALEINLAYPPSRKPQMPSLFNEPFTIDMCHMPRCLDFKEGYKVTLKWRFLAYLDGRQDIMETRKGIIREMNRVVYGEFTNELREILGLINYGREDQASEKLDAIIKHIQQHS